MNNQNIIRMDSKGRILIPIHIREKMDIAPGTEMMIFTDDNNGHAKLKPFIREWRLILDSTEKGAADAAKDILSKIDVVKGFDVAGR
jgi:AbrB family looped-hinge helix DNA binding protein